MRSTRLEPVNPLLQLLADRDVLLIDGAMGTQLFQRGLGAGDSPEAWNLEQPERITDVHRNYIAAGSDIVVTNSFGGTRQRLGLHKLDDRVHEINKAAALCARVAADAADRPVLVAGSMGPTGELLEPMGSMTIEECRAAFAEQAAGLAEGGADLIWIETMSDLGEVACAVEGARAACDLPIVVTLSFDTAGCTMMGVTGTLAATRLAELGVVGMGANCGNNLAETEAALAEMLAVDAGALVIAKANAGIPEWCGGDLSYSGTPEVMGAYAARMRDAGVRVIGACCGSAPEHLALMRQVLDGTIPVPDVEAPRATIRDPGDTAASRRAGRRASSRG